MDFITSSGAFCSSCLSADNSGISSGGSYTLQFGAYVVDNDSPFVFDYIKLSPASDNPSGSPLVLESTSTQTTHTSDTLRSNTIGQITSQTPPNGSTIPIPPDLPPTTPSPLSSPKTGASGSSPSQSQTSVANSSVNHTPSLLPPNPASGLPTLAATGPTWSKAHLPIGAIVGGVLGALITALLLVMLFLRCRRKRVLAPSTMSKNGTKINIFSESNDTYEGMPFDHFLYL